MRRSLLLFAGLFALLALGDVRAQPQQPPPHTDVYFAAPAAGTGLCWFVAPLVEDVDNGQILYREVSERGEVAGLYTETNARLRAQEIGRDGVWQRFSNELVTWYPAHRVVRVAVARVAGCQ